MNAPDDRSPSAPEPKYLTQAWATREYLAVLQHPELAIEFYARVGYKLRDNIPLSAEERAILADVLDRIVSISADSRKRGDQHGRKLFDQLGRALSLTARRGRTSKKWRQENLDMVNSVRELRAKGDNQTKAFAEVAGRENMSVENVEKIYRSICKSTGLEP